VDYDVLPGTQAERDSAIGIPTGAAFSPDGLCLYVTSLASNRLAVLDPLALDGAAAVRARVPTVTGPTGVVSDSARGRLYVVGRFRNQLQTLSATDLTPLDVTPIGFDPTPDEIVNGRRFFYGGFTSAHGDQACATCHVFGDFDNLAWDLGDPNGQFQNPPPGMLDPFLEGFDPEKGPMTTQTLRGLPGTGILHWRGDRTDLAAFNPAFVGLMGRETALADSEMAAFGEFVMALVHPPNPAQHLDRTMPDAPPGQPSARRGQDFFMNVPTDGGALTCNQCHTVPTGTNGQVINDAALQEDQDIKVPQLRNMYRKTGFDDRAGVVNKRGFGFIHDGSVDDLFDFLHFPGFAFPGGDPQRRDVEAFLLAFDTGMPPAVGTQITFHGANNADPTALARLDSLRTQHGSCDVVAKGRVGGQPRGWVYLGADTWSPDKSGEADASTASLVALGGSGSEVTFIGVPLGSGERAGVDRDRDGHLDGDELDAGSDPGDPASTPGTLAVRSGAAPRLAFDGAHPNPFGSATAFVFTLGRPARVTLAVYDVLGREVAAVARDQRFEAGGHRVPWDGRTRAGLAAPAGVYFARFEADGHTATRAVLRVR